MFNYTLIFILIAFFLNINLFALNQNKNKFKQLKQELPDPNSYRTASGAPGHKYWQNRADYNIDVTLDEENQKIFGEVTIKYYNNSPDVLDYLWLQLDQNRRSKHSLTDSISQQQIYNSLTFKKLKGMHSNFDGGFKIDYIKDISGKSLNYVLNFTMMRVDMPKTLKPGETFSFKIKYWYNLNERMVEYGRSGYEHFKEDGNDLYTIAQFFPRMCDYNDIEGWQNKQYLGSGEFALPFGDYQVNITVPSDHILGATGDLLNAEEVLTAQQLKRLSNAKKSFEKTVIIVTQDEAIKNEKNRTSKTKTWKFRAENVRDFAFASSRKFIWDAMAVQLDTRVTMAMSLYPKEGNPLWERYSTKAVAHTLKVYSKYTIEYPYPVAYSVNAIKIGMEYPMISFNFGRVEKDSTYSEHTKNRTIGVIIHEVGHNFFPMIINSDERQWTWMDEGLNTFVQYLTEVEWDDKFPSRRGPSYLITNYMKKDKSNLTPIMTNAESLFNKGANGYGKPAAALNILRETVLGPELFDFAFKQYCERWAFKHPYPADLFRTLEDASGTDLDWFWRGWFYTTDHVDMAINNVKWFQIDSQDPEKEYDYKKNKGEFKRDNFISHIRNKKRIEKTYVQNDEELQDFYTEFDKYKGDKVDLKKYKKYIDSLKEEDIELLESGYNYYEIEIENLGGLPMPLILKFEFEDGSFESRKLPAEIWKFDHEIIHKVFFFKKEMKRLTLDPNFEIADIDMENNYWPQKIDLKKFKVKKHKDSKKKNRMQRAKD